jgi:hypothetical protein
MATTHNFITLSNTTPVQVSEPSNDGPARDITLQNVNASGYIYIGDSSVTSSNYGYRISPNTAISFELLDQDEIFAISENNAMNLAVISVNLKVGR